MRRRDFLLGSSAALFTARFAFASTPDSGRKLADAARRQLGVTTGYDPAWTHLAYPGGDVPRSTGVCADVVIRAARDGLGLDLQKLVHEDMAKNFSAYPARHAWGSQHPDTNIDHRRVLNLQTYFQRSGAQLWLAAAPTPGDGFPRPVAAGDILTWLLVGRLPHIGVVVSSAATNREARVVHNIGRGVEESALADFSPERAVGHYRWPAGS
jgi:hypothetical protein